MTLKAAVIGVGNWGGNYLRVLHRLGDVSLAACCDQNADLLKEPGRMYPGLKISTTENEILTDRDIQAVVVATPPHTHFAIAQCALSAGKHVLVEKPFALSLGEAAHLFAIAEKQKLVLMAGHVLEYHPSVRWLKHWLQSGKPGSLCYLSLTRSNLGVVRRDVNVLWDLAVHDLAILRYLIDIEPESVSATGACYLQPDIYDVVFITIRFPGGIVAQLQASWLEPCKTRRIAIVGSRQMAVFDDVMSRDKICIYDRGISQVTEPANHGSVSYRFVPRYGGIFIPAVKEAEPLEQQCRHFIDCIRQKQEPLTGRRDILWVTEAAALAERSLNNGGIPVAYEQTERGTVI